MIDYQKIKQWLCKNIIGHKFSGYELMNIQIMPQKFYCSRCNSVRSVYEGWN